MTSQQIKSFLTVAGCLSFTAAAEQLYLSQSVVSYHIRTLEKEVGFTLLERDTHGVRLTASGQELYQSLSALSLQLEAALERGRRLAGGGDQRLRICFASPSSPTMMGQILAQICALAPGQELSLINWNLKDVFQPLLSQEAELLLTYPGFFREGLGLERAPLFRTWIACLMRPGHPLAHSRQLTMDALAGQTVIFPDIPNAQIELREVYQRLQHRRDTISVNSTPKSMDHAQAIAQSSDAVMFLHTLDRDYHGNMDGLTAVPMVDIPPEELIAVWRKGCLGAAGKKLVKHFQRNLADKLEENIEHRTGLC